MIYAAVDLKGNWQVLIVHVAELLDAERRSPALSFDSRYQVSPGTFARHASQMALDACSVTTETEVLSVWRPMYLWHQAAWRSHGTQPRSVSWKVMRASSCRSRSAVRSIKSLSFTLPSIVSR